MFQRILRDYDAHASMIDTDDPLQWVARTGCFFSEPVLFVDQFMHLGPRGFLQKTMFYFRQLQTDNTTRYMVTRGGSSCKSMKHCMSPLMKSQHIRHNYDCVLCNVVCIYVHTKRCQSQKMRVMLCGFPGCQGS